MYLHGDHLGSTLVLSRQDGTSAGQWYTPWGDRRTPAALAGTTREYTGQQRDDTGLLFYNARYYDPVLARFVSPDTIGPPHGNPQARNRYSYALNNPLKFTDPTGHCTYEPQTKTDIDENERCAAYEKELNELGVSLEWLYNWMAEELGIVLQGLRDLMEVSSWSVAQFNAAMGGDVALVRIRATSGLAAYQGGHAITFWDGAFNSGRERALRTVVHEFAHQWDAASGGRLSGGLVQATQGKASGCIDVGSVGACFGTYEAGDQAGRPYLNDNYYKTNKYEDFAESVAVTVYGSDNPRYKNGRRDTFVRSQFYNYGGWPPPQPCWRCV